MSSDSTPNLKLPYIAAAQAQKHVTHNEAIRALDAVVQLSVLDRDLSAPPALPVDGARYIVAGAPTGVWAGHAGHIAAFQDGAWAYYAPNEGWLAWLCDEDASVAWNGTAWVAIGGGSGSVNPTPLVGVNATADASNRLSVSSPATLFNHEGAGHRLKVNKATAGDTASLLFQTGFSGRAEVGLAGDNDYHVKVSTDGTTWKEAIRVDGATGVVSFPFTTFGGGGGGRPVLTANRTYYVRTDGSDANTGLADNAGGAFLTIQKACDVAGSLDFSIYNVTIQIRAGTYNETVTLRNFVGAGVLTITGDTTTPSNVVINGVASYAVLASAVTSAITVQGVELRVTTGSSLFITSGSSLAVNSVVFGACSGYHIVAAYNSRLNITPSSTYAITGNAAGHYYASDESIIIVAPQTVTVTGTPVITKFATAQRLGMIYAGVVVYSGSATGQRYYVPSNGLIDTAGGGASFFPGSSAGSTATQGQYL